MIAMGSQWLVVPVLLRVVPVFIVLPQTPPAMNDCDCHSEPPTVFVIITRIAAVIAARRQPIMFVIAAIPMPTVIRLELQYVFFYTF